MALFAGAYCTNRKLAVAAPLAALFLSDLILEFTTRIPGIYTSWLATGSGFHTTWWAIYGSVALIAGIGMLLQNRRRSVPAIAIATMVSSVLFFIVTNFAVWLDGSVGYPKTWAGLVECFAAGLAFYRETYSFAGDAFFVVVLFGGFTIAEKWLPALKPAEQSA
jgi:hypothetical protein